MMFVVYLHFGILNLYVVSRRPMSVHKLVSILLEARYFILGLRIFSRGSYGLVL